MGACCGVCFWVFVLLVVVGCVFGYRYKRRFEPFALSVRYALGCKFLLEGV